jgi:hypothetical protein
MMQKSSIQYVVSLGGKDGTWCLIFDQPKTSIQLSNELILKLQRRAVTTQSAATSISIIRSSFHLDDTLSSSSSTSCLSLSDSDQVEPRFLFLLNGKPILDIFNVINLNNITNDGNYDNGGKDSVFLTAMYRGAILGGKGGFGANLRAAGRTAGKKSTTDFGLCRDLQGRRLRDVNNEIRLKTWLAPSEVARREQLGSDYKELKGEGGLNGWFLGVPSWADGVGGGKSKGDAAELRDRKRKTSVCIDWKKAREERNPPPNSPRWWGCPRGRTCDFAHGQEELRGGNGAESVAETAKQRALAERQARLDAYTKGLYVYGQGNDDNEEDDEERRNGSGGGVKRMHSSIAQGMLEASSSTSMASRYSGLVGKGTGGLKRQRASTVDNKEAEEAEDDDDDNDGAIMIGFAKSKSRASRKQGGTWEGVVSSTKSSSSSSSSSTTRLGDGVFGHDPLKEDVLCTSSSSSSQPSRILAVSEKFSPSKWLVVSDAPLGRAVAGEAAAAVEYHSISVTPLEELLIKEGEGGERSMTSSASISTMSLPLSSSESSVAEVTGLLEFATVAVSGVHINPSSSSSSSSSSPSCCFYYEVELVTCTGIIQIGWAMDGFAPNVNEGNGVGDCAKSWAFDGLRGLFWHGGDNTITGEDGAIPFVGPMWAAGDVIGCWIRLLGAVEEEEKEVKSESTGIAEKETTLSNDHIHRNGQLVKKEKVEIGLSVNGVNIGSPMIVKVERGVSLFPAVSLDAGEIVRVNLGTRGFAYPSGKTVMISISI